MLANPLQSVVGRVAWTRGGGWLGDRMAIEPTGLGLALGIFAARVM